MQTRAGLPEHLLQLQRTADSEHLALQQLSDSEERRRQRQFWFEAAYAVQTAVTLYAQTKGLNHFEVERTLHGIVRGASR